MPEIDSRHAERWSQNTSWPTQLWGYYSSDGGIFKAFYRDIMINTIHIYTWYHQQYDEFARIKETSTFKFMNNWQLSIPWNFEIHQVLHVTDGDNQYQLAMWHAPCTVKNSELEDHRSRWSWCLFLESMSDVFSNTLIGDLSNLFLATWFDVFRMKALWLKNWNLGTTRSCHVPGNVDRLATRLDLGQKQVWCALQCA